jgi:hypothetical protein
MAGHDGAQGGTPSSEPVNGAAVPAGQATPVAGLAQAVAGQAQPADSKAAAGPGLGLNAAALALYAGWTMAVLFGTINTAANRLSELPTVNELAPEQRRELEQTRLRHLLTDLLSDEFAGLATLDQMPVGDDEDAGAPQLLQSPRETRKNALLTLNLQILTALTDSQPEIQLAYQLGRSLRDTANPPNGTPKGLAVQLSHSRIAKLQEWLAILAPEFPKLTTAVVAASLGRWSDLAAVTVVDDEPAGAKVRRLFRPRLPRSDKRETIAEQMVSFLLPQGDAWLMLLIGELETSGLLTPEGYVTAGESALRRTGAIVRSIIRHYWFGLLCVLAALFGALFLASRYLEGGGKVWTSIAAIVGACGVSAQTIASTASRLVSEAERPVFAMAEEDALAWAVTTLPPLDLSFTGVRHLRRAGVAPTASLSRF